jgi:hypothetical protein
MLFMKRKTPIDVEWERLADASVRTGLSIPEIYRRCITGELESAHIVKPGKRRGLRLVSKKSLDGFIRSFVPGGSRHVATPKQEVSVK